MFLLPPTTWFEPTVSHRRARLGVVMILGDCMDGGDVLIERGRSTREGECRVCSVGRSELVIGKRLPVSGVCPLTNTA